MEDEFNDRAPGVGEEPTPPGEDEDEHASRERAERLRREIEQVREGSEPASGPESPRDFVERRRRELEGEDTDGDDSAGET
jgi:hypothetical protein